MKKPLLFKEIVNTLLNSNFRGSYQPILLRKYKRIYDKVLEISKKKKFYGTFTEWEQKLSFVHSTKKTIVTAYLSKLENENVLKLPPLIILKTNEGYLLVDGHHRFSVFRQIKNNQNIDVLFSYCLLDGEMSLDNEDLVSPLDETKLAKFNELNVFRTSLPLPEDILMFAYFDDSFREKLAIKLNITEEDCKNLVTKLMCLKLEVIDFESNNSILQR